MQSNNIKTLIILCKELSGQIESYTCITWIIDITSSLIFNLWHIVSFYFWNSIPLNLQLRGGRWLTCFPLPWKYPRLEPVLSVSNGGWQCQDGLWPCQDVESAPRSLLVKDAVLWTSGRPSKRILTISDASSYPLKTVQNILFFRKYSGLFPSVTALTICLFVLLVCTLKKEKENNILGKGHFKKSLCLCFMCLLVAQCMDPCTLKGN